MECHECVFEGSRFVISVSEIAQNLREGLFHRELFEGRRIFTSERALRIRQMKGTCSLCGYNDELELMAQATNPLSADHIIFLHQSLYIALT